jgi:aminoglycoside phosphotransferase (APT) family kinase protein
MIEIDTTKLSTCFDELETRDGDAEGEAWLDRMLETRETLGDLISKVCKRRVKEHVEGWLKGSFNLGFRYKFDDGGPDAFIRFAKPGHTATALRDEKVLNEVRVLEFLREKTTIPVPRVYHWALTADSPEGLGPFMIMEFVEGVKVISLLMPPEDPVRILNSHKGDDMLDKIYYQISNYLLQLARIPFPRIGAISQRTDSNEWVVENRPLTYNDNELVSTSSFPIREIPQSPFDTTRSFFEASAATHDLHLHA